MAATDRIANMSQMLSCPRAANAPAVKRRESPGRNGVSTSPVSQKITRKKIT
jgi:hypothetical protein